MLPELLASTASLLFALDLIGTFVFALSGAASGVKNKLDAFGVGVLAFVAGNAGGVTRDVLIGAVPPAAINNWRYVAVSLTAAALTFVSYPNVKRLQPIVLLFDAAGLGLFAVSGTQKALAFGIDPIESALLGMLTGIGGGVLRDLLVNEIPVVLHTDFYALAALAGAAVVVAGHLAGWPPVASTIAGATLCFVIRLIAIRRGWSLPPAR
ncbi:MAG TPA: trimeric intracellular cation channel family protein [Vicinamibacterales bacterium]